MDPLTNELIVQEPQTNSNQQTSDHDQPVPSDNARNYAAGYDPINFDNTSIMFVMDSSGSMRDAIEGGAKHILAKRALIDIIEGYSRSSIAPETLEMGLMSFSSETRTVRQVSQFNRQSLISGVHEVPFPDGGTAIGDALIKAERNLDRSGTGKKYIILLTDGQNTEGFNPDDAVRIIQAANEAQSDWRTEIHVIAYNTSASFDSLSELGVHVYTADNTSELVLALEQTRELILERPTEYVIE